MNNIQSLSHTAWDCKYHLIWIPKYRKKLLFGQLRRYLGSVLHELASHLFIVMSRNAADAPSFFYLPADQTIEGGVRLEI